MGAQPPASVPVRTSLMAAVHALADGVQGALDGSKRLAKTGLFSFFLISGAWLTVWAPFGRAVWCRVLL